MTNTMSALVFIVLAFAAGWLVNRMAPVRLPYGTVASALAGLVLSVLVALPLGDQGPHLFAVALIPAAAGALVGAIAVRAALAHLSAADR